MKKLERQEAPDCLSNFKHGIDSWGAVPKDEIWPKLEQMQGEFCAYCECRLKEKSKHIEHFRKRETYPDKTFNWGNLFGSCGDPQKTGGWGRCGIYKDNRKLNPPCDINKLIKPDEEDPGDYLLFLTSGHVVPQRNLCDRERQKAEETIRVFNLNNDTSLFNSRKNTIECIKNEIRTLYECLDDINDSDCQSWQEWEKLREEYTKEIKGKEFQTALEHAWKYNRDYA
ncbi:conserved hypothetical protein [Xenorhabdus bovienii str. kraussei Quebec]|uniref:TIGR02646 family protein n=1 Tax=Xenorhabdus bovienii str. kraussei Quebec TaxID=1398203 RepID=A0A077PI48_XENBV|nr:retron Ec78 anti-phage system effector HNH endonuclease PtuB [Xenorhabdus bovienii]MDE1473044.1 TIGR02646 family protein [Xenorhabdus bovienii]CDH20703.1 conserved hypothetical protein [Xenorhabdus bovienii str. kraussei Quebec]